MKNIGKQLKRIRDEKGFPQKLVAEHLGLHRSNYSRIENNIQKLTPEQIILFCEFCDISSDYLLGIKSANQKVVSLTDLDEINQKLKEIDELLNN